MHFPLKNSSSHCVTANQSLLYPIFSNIVNPLLEFDPLVCEDPKISYSFSLRTSDIFTMSLDKSIVVFSCLEICLPVLNRKHNYHKLVAGSEGQNMYSSILHSWFPESFILVIPHHKSAAGSLHLPHLG